MRATRIALALAGTAAMAYAVVGVATTDGARPLGQLAFLAAVLFGHDLVLMPAAIAVGAVAGRLAPDWARGAVYGALFASAVLTLIAIPFLLGYGRPADDPSSLPLPYGRGLLVILALIWAVAALVAGRNWVRRRGRAHHDA
jgi:hypothetical protein